MKMLSKMHQSLSNKLIALLSENNQNISQSDNIEIINYLSKTLLHLFVGRLFHIATQWSVSLIDPLIVIYDVLVYCDLDRWTMK